MSSSPSGRKRNNSSSAHSPSSNTSRRGAARCRANTLSWPAGPSSERDVDGTPVRVFTAEHLAAIALQTGTPRTKPACSSSSRPARSMPPAFGLSSPGMGSLTVGGNSSDNSSLTRHELRPAKDARKQTRFAPPTCRPARGRKAADARCAAATRAHPSRRVRARPNGHRLPSGRTSTLRRETGMKPAAVRR